MLTCNGLRWQVATHVGTNEDPTRTHCMMGPPLNYGQLKWLWAAFCSDFELQSALHAAVACSKYGTVDGQGDTRRAPQHCCHNNIGGPATLLSE